MFVIYEVTHLILYFQHIRVHLILYCSHSNGIMMQLLNMSFTFHILLLLRLLLSYISSTYPLHCILDSTSTVTSSCYIFLHIVALVTFIHSIHFSTHLYFFCAFDISFQGLDPISKNITHPLHITIFPA